MIHPGLAFTLLLLPLTALFGDPEAAASFDYCTAQDAEISDETATGIEAGLSGTEREQAAALLIKAGNDIASAATNEDQCTLTFRNGRDLFDQRLERSTRKLRREARVKKSRDRKIATIQSDISAQWLKDQAGRLTYISLQTKDRSGEQFWAQRLATAHTVVIDAESIDLMREILKDYDWIDRERFGAKTSSRAWILVQHADDHPDFQQQVLERMEVYLASGGVRRQEYAYLYDRVAVNTGQLQRYGTQPENSCNEDGTLDLQPVEDVENLDAIRSEMNLGPYKADLDRMAATRCGG